MPKASAKTKSQEKEEEAAESDSSSSSSSSEAGEASSSSSGESGEEASSSDESAGEAGVGEGAQNGAAKPKKRGNTGKAKGGPKKPKKSGASSSSSAPAAVGPMLTIKHPNREGHLWPPEVLAKFTIAEVVGELGGGASGRVEMTGEALAILQASTDVLVDRALSEALLYIKLLKERAMWALPSTGAPYLKGERKNRPRAGEKAVPDFTIFPRHVDTVLRADGWLSRVAGRRFSAPSNVFMPSVTLAGPKKKIVKSK